MPATRQPSAASVSATQRPMPLDEPVTTATRSSRPESRIAVAGWAGSTDDTRSARRNGCECAVYRDARAVDVGRRVGCQIDGELADLSGGSEPFGRHHVE